MCHPPYQPKFDFYFINKLNDLFVCWVNILAYTETSKLSLVQEYQTIDKQISLQIILVSIFNTLGEPEVVENTYKYQNIMWY